MQYARWKEECKDMDSHVGSGKIITAPIITEDGFPIKDPLVLLEAASGTQCSSTSNIKFVEVGDFTTRVTNKEIIDWKLTLHQIGRVQEYVFFLPPPLSANMFFCGLPKKILFGIIGLDVLRTDRSMVFYERKEIMGYSSCLCMDRQRNWLLSRWIPLVIP
jgi:hypothetical protein